MCEKEKRHSTLKKGWDTNTPARRSFKILGITSSLKQRILVTFLHTQGRNSLMIFTSLLVSGLTMRS